MGYSRVQNTLSCVGRVPPDTLSSSLHPPRLVLPYPLPRVIGHCLPTGDPLGLLNTGVFTAPDVSWLSRLDGLDSAAATLVHFGIAPRTRKAYSTALASYEWYLALSGIALPIPASAAMLCNWIANEARRGLRYGTCLSYLTGLHSYHVDLGLPTLPFDDPCLSRLERGIKQVQGDREKRLCLPIIFPLLVKILDAVNAGFHPHAFRASSHLSCLCRCVLGCSALR